MKNFFYARFVLLCLIVAALSAIAHASVLPPAEGSQPDVYLEYIPVDDGDPPVYPAFLNLKSVASCRADQICTNPGCFRLSSSGAYPEIGSSGGNASSNVLVYIHPYTPRRLVLVNDSYFAGENLNLTLTLEAISLAAQTWNYYANTNFFYYDVTANASAVADNKTCLIRWNQFEEGFSGLGSLSSTYKTSDHHIIKCEILLSTKYNWGISYVNNSQGVDVQSVVLHEMGHAVGLGDIYSLPANDSRKRDIAQVMNAYYGPKHLLGEGDKAGLQAMYGCGVYSSTTTLTTTTSLVSTSSTSTTLTTTTSLVSTSSTSTTLTTTTSLVSTSSTSITFATTTSAVTTTTVSTTTRASTTTTPLTPSSTSSTSMRTTSSSTEPVTSTSTSSLSPSTTVHLDGDANGDGLVNYEDLIILASSYDRSAGEAGYNPRADFDFDGSVGYLDLIILASNYGVVPGEFID